MLKFVATLRGNFFVGKFFLNNGRNFFEAFNDKFRKIFVAIEILRAREQKNCCRNKNPRSCERVNFFIRLNLFRGELQNAFGHFVFVANVFMQNFRGRQRGKIFRNCDVRQAVEQIQLLEVVNAIR